MHQEHEMTYGCDCCEHRETVAIGKPVPDMELDAYHKDEEHKIRLSDYKGKWLILFFYPADFTFVCPTELENMAEHYDKFVAEDAEILSVSTDTVWTHKAWHDTSDAIKKITFPMLADRTAKLTKMMGVYIPEEGNALRGTFIIDPEGILRGIEINHNDVGRSAKELLRKIKAFKFVRENKGKVCPANWEPGDDTLEPGLGLVGKI